MYLRACGFIRQGVSTLGMRKISKRKDRDQGIDLGIAVGKLACGHMYYGARVSSGSFVMCIACNKARQVVA
jgi:hypothetical protein